MYIYKGLLPNNSQQFKVNAKRTKLRDSRILVHDFRPLYYCGPRALLDARDYNGEPSVHPRAAALLLRAVTR